LSLRLWLIYATLWVCAWLPLSWVRALGYLAPYLAPKKVRFVVKTNLTLCFPELSPAEHAQQTRQVLIHNGQSLLELGKCWLRSPAYIQSLIHQVHGEEHVHAALAQGRGVLLMTPHFGAWEVAGLYVSLHYPITSLYRPPKLRQLDSFIQQCRQRGGGRLVPTTPRGVKALLDRLRAGEAAGILPDQDPGKGNGLFAPFFNQPAYTLQLVSRLLQKTGARAVFAYTLRVPGGFQLVFFPAPEEIYHLDPYRSVAALNHGIALCICAEPAQYLWSYKRFKTTPPGMKSRYDESNPT